MKITAELLRSNRPRACEDQAELFAAIYPDGLVPTVEALSVAAAEGLDVWWASRLLPREGPGSRRAYALWCAELVARHSADSRVAKCLAGVRQRVEDVSSVSDAQLDAIRDVGQAAVWSAAGPVAQHVAKAAVRAAAGDAMRPADWSTHDAAGAAADAGAAIDAVEGTVVRAAQLAQLAQLLMEVD